MRNALTSLQTLARNGVTKHRPEDALLKPQTAEAAQELDPKSQQQDKPQDLAASLIAASVLTRTEDDQKQTDETKRLQKALERRARKASKRAKKLAGKQNKQLTKLMREQEQQLTKRGDETKKLDLEKLLKPAQNAILMGVTQATETQTPETLFGQQKKGLLSLIPLPKFKLEPPEQKFEKPKQHPEDKKDRPDAPQDGRVPWAYGYSGWYAHVLTMRAHAHAARGSSNYTDTNLPEMHVS